MFQSKATHRFINIHFENVVNAVSAYQAFKIPNSWHFFAFVDDKASQDANYNLGCTSAQKRCTL